jgi:hypothetical protein
MPGVGEYRPDASEGIMRVEDLPKPTIVRQSRNSSDGFVRCVITAPTAIGRSVERCTTWET